jgi:hypothetical protein
MKFLFAFLPFKNKERKKSKAFWLEHIFQKRKKFRKKTYFQEKNIKKV